MKKLLSLLLFTSMCSLYSCDNIDLSIYNLQYNVLTDIISINNFEFNNMNSNQNVLNKISFRPSVENNSFLLSSNEKIFSIKIKSNFKCRFVYINENVYEIFFIEKDWFKNNNNIELELITI